MERIEGKATRLEQMKLILLAHPEGLSRAEVARRLGVHRSTVGRYVEALHQMGVPIWEEGQRIGILRDRYLVQVSMTTHEALALHLAARLLAQRVDEHNPHAASALRKLGEALRYVAPLISRHLLLSAEVMEDQARRQDPNFIAVLETLTRAWAEERKVKVWHWHESTRQVYEYRLAPYFLEPYAPGRTIHVIGWREPPGALRTLKVERIRRVELTAERYTIPADFDPRDLLREAWGIWYTETEPAEVVLRFHPRVAHRVRETRWHPSEQVTEQPDGSLLWRARIAEPREMLPWIRGWGADVEVLAPPALRQAVEREVSRLMRLYLSHERPQTPYEALWAKASPDGSAYHPLLYHLFDVAACAEGLWEHALTAEARAQLAQDLNRSEDDVRRMFVFLAGAHDIGKASPAFQTKVSVLSEALQAWGYDFPQAAARNGTHHSIISTWILKTWLRETLAWPKPTARLLARAVGAHHGRWPTDEEIIGLDDRRLGDLGHAPLWAESRRTLLEALAQAFPPPRGEVRLPRDVQAKNRVLALLAGFITVADWLGSMEDFFPYEERVLSTEAYLPIARERAQRALQATGWLQAWQTPQGETASFTQAFPFPPNAIQAEAIRQAQAVSHPALLIVEAPTGQGKTELALYLADAWLQRRRGRGLYIAMPTQATSNAMYPRLRHFLQRRYPEQRLPVVLAHSHADETLPRLQGVGEASQEEEAAAVEWFLPRKRALLAPFGVGTVDQALMGTLQARHHYLRLFGLAHKVVIFDEVHAYDTYMERLFQHLLTWLRAVGTSVIVLSATLPRNTRQALVKAWGGSAQALGSAPYPRLTLVTDEQAREHPLPAPPTRTVTLGWIEQAEPAALAAWLEAQLAQGGCAAVICNTVDRAQAVYEAIRERFSAQERGLFHARMPFAWREEEERLALERFGKEASQRPSRFVLVATQVIEQSLDLDFDLLVSELAPVDLVIQRAGRLHRHPGRRRPPGLAQPTLWLLRPGGDLTAPDFGPSEHIYAPYILWRTYLALHGKKTLRLPEETDALIEAVYRDAQDHPSDPLLQAHPKIASALTTGLREAWNAWQMDIQKAEHEASSRLIPSSGETVLTEEAFGAALDDDTEARKHPALKALTRLITPGITLLPLYRQPDGRVTLTPDGGPEVNLSQRPSPDLARAMRRFLMTVHHRGLVNQKGLPDPPAAWQRVAGLRGVLPIVFEAQRAQIGPWTLILDREFGLRIRKEES